MAPPATSRELAEAVDRVRLPSRWSDVGTRPFEAMGTEAAARGTLPAPGCPRGLRSHPSNLIRLAPAKGGRAIVDVETAAWGIEPVPERLRVLGFLDVLLLWANLSISLLVIVLGAFLVPALSLKGAFGAILVGAVAGNLLLGLAGMIGADARVPGMVLLRAPLGQRGSFAPTLVNVAQNLGWSTFELIIISTAAAALSERVFGFEARWLWALVFGAVSVALGL